jgi:hypothetical protein
MATLVPTAPSRAGTTTSGAAVASTDTIPASALTSGSALLEIINGNAGADSITITDSGTTPAGSPLSGGTYSASVAAGTSKIFLISARQANPANGTVTITHSVTATVTYKLYPR